MSLLQDVGIPSDSPYRFYCRIVFTKKLGLDDYFIALALVVVTILAIFNVFQISWGAG